MKWYIPREHGAWSMWITPYLIGAFISPWTWMKVIAFAGLFFLYMSSAPLLEYVRCSRRKKASPLPSLLIFSFTGLLLILFPVLSDPSILWYCGMALPFFLVNLYSARRKKERLIINDIAAIIALSASSLLAVHLGYGGYHPIGLYVWLLSIFYFTGTVFHAKSMIRERGNRLIKRAANLYHALYVIIPIFFGLWWVSLIYLPSALKVWLTPFNSKIRPITLGVMEIGFSVLFFIMSVWLMGQFVII